MSDVQNKNTSMETPAPDKNLIDKLLVDGFVSKKIKIGKISAVIRSTFSIEDDAIQVYASQTSTSYGIFGDQTPINVITNKALLAVVLIELNGKPLVPALPSVASATVDDFVKVISSRIKMINPLPHMIVDYLLREYNILQSEIARALEEIDVGES